MIYADVGFLAMRDFCRGQCAMFFHRLIRLGRLANIAVERHFVVCVFVPGCIMRNVTGCPKTYCLFSIFVIFYFMLLLSSDIVGIN